MNLNVWSLGTSFYINFFIKKIFLSYVYMNATDKRILDFHLANLEYGIGASVYSASLKYWDHDDSFSFDGSHLMSNFFLI